MSDDQEVQTEADELIRLLGTAPEMSIPELAKRLRIPEATVEAISTFLEEEGLVAIQYKMTNPYVSLTDSSPRLIAPVPKDEDEVSTYELAKDFTLIELEKQVEWLSSTWTTLNEYELATKISLFLDQLAKLANVVVKDQGPLNHSVEVRNELAAALRINEEIKKHLQMGEHSVAQDLFGDLLLRIRKLIKKAHSLTLMVHYSPVLPENSVTVMGKVRELMEHKKFEEAESLYSLLKNKATEFPTVFHRKELQFDTDLSQLNQDLFSGMEKHRSEQFAIMAKEMEKIIGEIKALIAKKEVSLAEQRMRNLRIMLAELPDIHPQQKSEMESKVMRIQNMVLAIKGTYHTEAFNSKTKALQDLSTRMDAAIQKSDMEKAAELYRDMKLVFQTLPDSFPDKKMLLQQSILQAFERLTSAYTQYNEAQFQMMEKELISSLSEMAVLVKTKDYEKAAGVYLRVKQIFYNLPAGHLPKKIQLQQDILSVFDVFKRNYPQAVVHTFMQIQSEIKGELERAKAALRAGDMPSSWNHYRRLLELFRRLPIIGPEQRRDIRMHILGLYRNLLELSDQHHMKNLDERQNEIYQRLLSLVMQFHDQVHERAFDSLMPTYSIVTKLFHELPMRIATSDIRLKQEITTMGHEVQLVAQAKELKQQRENHENEKANLNAQTLRKNMVLVRTQNPTDDELFSYIDRLTTNLTSSLSSLPGLRGKAPARLPGIDAAMKNLTEVAQQQSKSKPATTEVAEKIQSLKQLAYPSVKVPT